MHAKFDITGTRPRPEMTPQPDANPAIEQFIAGREPMRTMSIDIPARLLQELKRQALERQMTMKALLREIPAKALS